MLVRIERYQVRCGLREAGQSVSGVMERARQQWLGSWKRKGRGGGGEGAGFVSADARGDESRKGANGKT